MRLSTLTLLAVVSFTPSAYAMCGGNAGTSADAAKPMQCANMMKMDMKSDATGNQSKAAAAGHDGMKMDHKKMDGMAAGTAKAGCCCGCCGGDKKAEGAKPG